MHPASRHEIRLLVLTMPGFGLETLRRLDLDPRWPANSLLVGMIGRRPGCYAGWLLRALVVARPKAPRAGSQTLPLQLSRPVVGWRLDATNASGSKGTQTCDGCVRIGSRTDFTITSRVIFTELTLNDIRGEWLNVHPGLLPRYAGASPVPYMFLDGAAGCTIHRMTAGVDAGPVVDEAESMAISGPTAGLCSTNSCPVWPPNGLSKSCSDGATAHSSRGRQDASALHHCTSAQLRRDRQLDWSWEAPVLARWVHALMPYAPAFFIDRSRRHREVRGAVALAEPVAGAPGAVLEKQGHRVRVACRSGSVWLECCARPKLHVGDTLAGAAPHRI